MAVTKSTYNNTINNKINTINNDDNRLPYLNCSAYSNMYYMNIYWLALLALFATWLYILS